MSLSLWDHSALEEVDSLLSLRKLNSFLAHFPSFLPQRSRNLHTTSCAVVSLVSLERSTPIPETNYCTVVSLTVSSELSTTIFWISKSTFIALPLNVDHVTLAGPIGPYVVWYS